MSKPIDFKNLKLIKVINESTLKKFITFLGEYDGQTAVIRFDKEPFDENSTRSMLSDQDLYSERNLDNDIYSRYRLIPSRNALTNDVKAIVVVPADESVLAKYSRSETVLFSETPSIYETIVEPFLADLLSRNMNCNQWIYNILDGLSEARNVILNDSDAKNGFMLLPSLKSSGDEKDFHVLAICHRRDIRSLRDLNETHLSLLENILIKGTEALKKKYPYLNSLRSYIHYHPTFYHFHVHFENIDPSEYNSSDRDNLLTTVINNIKLKNDYYQLSTLTYPISKESPLYQALSNNCKPLDN